MAVSIPSGVKCYGHPDDCRGWVQFLVERICQRVNMPPIPNRAPTLVPLMVWVNIEKSPKNGKYDCDHQQMTIHENSIRAMAQTLNCPREAFPRFPVVCVECGRFIE